MSGLSPILAAAGNVSLMLDGVFEMLFWHFARVVLAFFGTIFVSLWLTFVISRAFGLVEQK